MQPTKSEPTPPHDDLGLARVLDIPVVIRVELGRRKMRIQELLRTGAGSVIDLQVPAGTPLSIYANDTLIAEGEAVLVGDRYGVRITDIISCEARSEQLAGGVAS